MRSGADGGGETKMVTLGKGGEIKNFGKEEY